MLNSVVICELTYLCLFCLLGDCRFSSTQGTLLSWDNIRDGINLTVEIAKVYIRERNQLKKDRNTEIYPF